jgi:hypothetical protein
LPDNGHSQRLFSPLFADDPPAHLALS